MEKARKDWEELICTILTLNFTQWKSTKENPSLKA